MLLSELKHLDATVRTGSQTEAAKVCFTVGQNVQSSIRKLEREFGFELFERHIYRGTFRRTCNLTENGKVVYDKITQILQLEEELVSFIDSLALIQLSR